MRASRCTVPVVLLLVLGGCGTADRPATPRAETSGPPAPGLAAVADDPHARLTGELLQFRRDAERRRVQVRVTAANDGLRVDRLTLDAAGFEPTSAAPGSELPGGRALDLKVRLGTVDCSAASGDVRAELALSDEAGARRTVVLPLADGGFAADRHESECAEAGLREQVGITLAGLRRADVDGRPALRATVRLTRLSGSAPIAVTGTADNTVYRITPAAALPTVAHGTTDFDLVLLPARCDSHALGESYRTGLIGVFVAVGDADPRPVVLAPEAADRRTIETFAVDACRGTLD
jgi:hypothetical protein